MFEFRMYFRYDLNIIIVLVHDKLYMCEYHINNIVLVIGMGNYSIDRENHDNLASNNRIVTIFLVFNNQKSQYLCIFLQIKVLIAWNPQPNFTNTFLNYMHCLLELIVQAYTLTIIVIIVIFSQEIIDRGKFQYRPSLIGNS